MSAFGYERTSRVIPIRLRIEENLIVAISRKEKPGPIFGPGFS